MNGSIQTRGKNTHKITIELGMSENGRRIRKYTTVKGTKADAKKKLRELLTAGDNGAPITTSKITLSEYLDEWLERKKSSKVTQKTIIDYAGIINRYLKPNLGHIQIGKLTPRHIEDLHTLMVRQGLSARSVQYTHRVLSQALKRAVELELINRNVCDVIAPPRIRRKAVRVMNIDEAERFLEATYGSFYWPVFFFAIYTGLRKGELLGLRWCDVDLQNATISVNHTATRITGKGIVMGNPKTDSSHRLVSLPASATRLLIDRKLTMKDERELIGFDWDDSTLVFSHPDGRPLSPDSVTHAFGKALKDAGLPHMRFHDLRHTHATILFKSGIDTKRVSDRLGHASISITLDTYTHILPGMREEVAQTFEEALTVNCPLLKKDPNETLCRQNVAKSGLQGAK